MKRFERRAERDARARRAARPHGDDPRDGPAGRRSSTPPWSRTAPATGCITRLAVRTTGAAADPAPRPAVPGRVERGRRAGGARDRARAPTRCWRRCPTCAPPTSRTPCRTCPTSAASRSCAALDDERLADVLQELAEDDQVSLLQRARRTSAPPTCSRRWTTTTPPTCSARCPTADQQRLLELMEPEEAEPVRRLMTYADYTAGGMMTSEPVILLPDATVAEALARVRNPELSPALAAQVFVVRPPQATPTGRFLGTAHLQRLLREPPSALVSGVVREGHRRAAPGHPDRRGHPPPRDLQPGRRAGRRRPRPAARRGLGRRRARPPAARGLARRRPRRAAAWLSGAPGSTSRRSTRGPRLRFDPDAFGG